MAPILPVPLYQNRPWGGTAFASLFSRSVPPETGEAWELSVHPHGLSRTSSGEVLRELYPDLALIFKLLDANASLSVQVHPAFGAEAKTEMWIVLSAAPGAALYAGIRPGETTESLAARIRNGTMEQAMVRHTVSEGDCIFLPGGIVHALGAGIVVAEIQQPGDTTFRLYDWGRPRELHIEQGLAAADIGAAPGLSRISDREGWQMLAECAFFSAASYRGRSLETSTKDRHTVLFVQTPCRVSTADGSVEAAANTTVFIPKDAGKFTVEGEDGVKTLIFRQNR